MQVVLDMAKRAAESEGSMPPDYLPPEAKKAWTHVHYMLGGNPRLLSFALEVMGNRQINWTGLPQGGADWNRGTLLVSSCGTFTALAEHLQSLYRGRLKFVVALQVFMSACWILTCTKCQPC